MNAQECIELRIEVRPSPETNDHEVQLLADGKSLVDRFFSGLIGGGTDVCAEFAESPCRKLRVCADWSQARAGMRASRAKRDPLSVVFYRTAYEMAPENVTYRYEFDDIRKMLAEVGGSRTAWALG